ncbi:MAG: stage II sporulation protein M [Halopenitus sp.]
MDLATAITDAVATFRHRPADLLPFYLLGAAVPVVARVPVLAAGTAVYVYLTVSGALSRFQARYAAAGLGSPPNPNRNPQAFSQWIERAGPIVESLIDPVVAGTLVFAGLLAALVALVTYAGVSAGQYTTCLARLRENRGLTAGVAGVREYWTTILGLYLLEIGIWVAVSLLATIVVAVAVATGITVLAALVTLLAFLAWSVVLAATRAVFAFAPAAAVVDEAGIVDAVEGALSYLFTNPVAVLGYLAVVVALGLLTTVLGATFSAVGAGSVVGLVTLLAITPVLDLLKVRLFGGWRGLTAPPAPPDARLRDQARNGLWHGWRVLKGFARDNPGYLVAATGLFVVGFAAGWVAASPFVGQIQASITARLAGSIPPVAAVEFMANNLTVAIGTALAGSVVGVPAAAALWFNGLFFGIYFRLEEHLLELVAFVLPHGVVEIPAILVAGAVGLRLGVVTWRTWRGSVSVSDLADALEESFWVLVGVGLLLVLAGLIEGFVSPYYYRAFLSGVSKLGL